MAVILPSERKTIKARAFLTVVYTMLTMGALTMVYPFLVMLSQSLCSSYDYQRHSPVVIGFFDESDRFVRSLSTCFKTFPRELYPDAPPNWTSWTEVAKDRAGVKTFAQKELAPYRDKNSLAGKRRAASEFIRALANAPARATTCHYDARDVERFVRKKYGTLEALDAAWGIPHQSFFDVSFLSESRLDPEKSVGGKKFQTWTELKRDYAVKALARGDYACRTMPHPLAGSAAAARNALCMQFIDHGWRDFLAGAFANYRLVGDYLFVRGRAFFNTLLLVLLSLAASLTVNPLSAYALSRFHLRSREKILLFLLATMAFPAAVTAIPEFLLIRDLGLLNTFAALVLPTVANGMSIFILKGFFDALPRELYEAAAIDGAGEWTVFRKITLPMTTPILAVNALNTFLHAYSSWEWAFLVCQKQSHWTIAVWMYQMAQVFSHQPWCVMAGFVIVSLPTAAVFLLCQRVIMRGIVLPSMK